MDKRSGTLWQLIERMMNYIFIKLLRLKEEQAQGLVQFVKFGIVGLSNTVVSYVIYIASLMLFQKLDVLKNSDYLVAQIIAFVLSVLWSFYWNNKYVFTEEESEKRNMFQALVKTYISYAFTGLFLNSILALLWVELLHMSKLIAPIINLLVSVPINFFMNKFWAFKKKPSEGMNYED